MKGIWHAVYFNTATVNPAEIGTFMDNLGDTSTFYFVALPWLIWWFLVALCLPNTMELASHVIQRPVLPIAWITAALAMPLFVLTFMSSRITEFIYFNF